MLRHDVVAAAAEGRFAVYPIDTVDQGLELLTGIPAGQPDADGELSGRHAQPADRRAARCLCRQGGRAGPRAVCHGRPPMSGPIERVVVPLDAASETRDRDRYRGAACRAREGAASWRLCRRRGSAAARPPAVRPPDLRWGHGAEPFTTEQVELHLRRRRRAGHGAISSLRRNGMQSSVRSKSCAATRKVRCPGRPNTILSSPARSPGRLLAIFASCRWLVLDRGRAGPVPSRPRMTWGATGSLVIAAARPQSGIGPADPGGSADRRAEARSVDR